MNIQEVIITIDKNNLNRIKQVANELSLVGLKVKEVHEMIGIITGSVDSSLRSGLINIVGVADVEDNRTIQLSPPDSKIQ